MLSLVFPFQESDQEVNGIFRNFFAYLQKSLCNFWNHIVDQVLSNGSWFFVQDFLFFGSEFFQIEFLLNLFLLFQIFFFLVLSIHLLFIFDNTLLILVLNDCRLFEFLFKPQWTILKST